MTRCGIPLLLLGCAGGETISSNKTKINAQVFWNEPCPPGLIACSVDVTPCFIYTRKPRDFEDRNALTSLGHEILHCLGWIHKP